MKAFKCLFFCIFLASILVPIEFADAEEVLTLIATIPVGTDSTQITSITPVGDFNADGYPDLLVGEGWPPDGDQLCLYEAAHLFYGGPGFDSIPDLTFQGDPQGDICTGDPLGELTGFGSEAGGLDDFNGDGFDDLAIGAQDFCEHSDCNGRIYIYFGGPTPDSIVDLVLTGQHGFDYLGQAIRGGDYDGNSLGDLLALVSDFFYGTTMSIYLGSSIPDTTTDWSYDPGHNLAAPPEWFYGGHDITGDGYDDFGWRLANNIGYFFLGGSPIPPEPADSTISDYPRFPGDVSGDGIEDFLVSGQGWFLCLGGDPLNVEPDYPLWSGPASSVFIYMMDQGLNKLVRVQADWHQIFLYNAGLPFDTLPQAIFDYSPLDGHGRVDIGNINGDSIDELVFLDTLSRYVYIHSIAETGMGNDDGLLPPNNLSMKCYPNPFNDATYIIINAASGVKDGVGIGIYDIRGQFIKKLLSQKAQGSIAVRWDATDASGKKVSSGLYFAVVINETCTAHAKLLYLK